MRVIRRISSAFKDIPGGQILGATSDYTLRLLDFELLEDDVARRQAFRDRILADLPEESAIPDSFPKVIDILRREGLLEETLASAPAGTTADDISRHPLTLPASRSASLQALARGETGGLLALAYSSMRGYGNIHPTLGELRIGYLPLTITHPLTGLPLIVGEVKITEAEVLARMDGSAACRNSAWATGSASARTRSRRSRWRCSTGQPARRPPPARPRTRNSSSTTPTASRAWASATTGNCRTTSISSPISTGCAMPRNWPGQQQGG